MRYLVSFCACLLMSVIANAITSTDAFLEVIVDMLLDGTPHFFIALVGLMPLMILTGIAIMIIKAANYMSEDTEFALPALVAPFIMYGSGFTETLSAGEVTGFALGIGLLGFILHVILLALCMKSE